MKIKTIFFLLINSLICSCSSKAQIGITTIDFKKIDYSMDVPFFYSNAMDINDFYNEAPDIFYFYDKDTLRFYNQETDELYPGLVRYNSRRWSEQQAEAKFDTFSLYKLGMATTVNDSLVLVSARIDLDETGVSALKKALDKKYGDSPQYRKFTQFERENHLWRWATPDEYIQLETSANDGKGSMIIEVTGDIQEPLKMSNAEPFIEANLYIWKKEYHDLVLIHSPLNLSKFEGERDSYHAVDARWYRPKEIKPFLITQNYLDSLASAGDVWSRIQLSYYRAIDENGITDKTGITDSIQFNKDGCLPCVYFGGLQRNFRDNLTNTEYMAREMRSGMKFSELMEDETFCRLMYMGEVIWKDKKKREGIIHLIPGEEGQLIIESNDLYPYYTVYEYPLCLTGRLKTSLQESRLDLEKTTAHLVCLPPGYHGVYLTDGNLELFTPMISENGIVNGKWFGGEVYPIIEVLEAIR